jgi:hypothetical protein
MHNQDKWAGFATLFGAMFIAIAVSMAFFLAKGYVPPFLLVVLPAMVGAGLLTAGLVHKRDNGWTHNEIQGRQS